MNAKTSTAILQTFETFEIAKKKMPARAWLFVCTYNIKFHILSDKKHSRQAFKRQHGKQRTYVHLYVYVLVDIPNQTERNVLE